MPPMIKVGILGVEGRMGQALLSEIKNHESAQLACVLTHADSKNLHALCGDLTLSADIRAGLDVCDVLIDFSHPKAAIDAALMMHGTKCKALVTGTTGYSDTEEKALEAAGDSIVLVKSGNFSIGICVLENLVAKASGALDDRWDFDVLDIHHRHKKDAPSGTAIMLGRAGIKASPNRSVEYAALRHGGVIGEHHVSFASEMETITLSHNANDRTVFARGALTAALWAVSQDKGLYGMKDVLGL